MAAWHHDDPMAFRWPSLVAARRRRNARKARRLREVDGFLDDLHTDLGDARSTLLRAVERYRRSLRAR